LAPAAAWRRKGAEIVWGEIAKQVHPDGVDFEQGIGYQGLVAEFWYSSVLLCERNSLAVPPEVRERLAQMFEFMQAVTRPDGTFPQIGDNDDGRLAGLDDEPVGSHQRHLAVGGAMFDRADLLAAAGEAVDTAVWLCGQAVLEPESSPRKLMWQRGASVLEPESSPRKPMRLCGPAVLESQSGTRKPMSRAFASGGFYVMRGDDAVLVIDAGEVGMRGIGGHGHNDVLSFDLWAAGADVLVDSGTYTYTADPGARQALRSTAAHNALRIDGEETSRLGGDRWLWLIENDAHPFDVSWQSDDQGDVFVGSHDGYRRLAEPVDHTRRIIFDKRRMRWVIEDTVSGTGTHLVELLFHPGVAHELVDGAVKLQAPRGDLWLFPPSETTFREEQGWISGGYGLRRTAQVLVYAVRAAVPISLRTDLVLVPAGTGVDAARSLVGADPGF
jgi:hypothetical protein